MKTILISILALTLFSSCNEKSSVQAEGTAEEAKGEQFVQTTQQSLDPIRSVLIESFWRATDETMRENLEMPGQTSKLEDFLAEHQIDVYAFEPSSDPAIPATATLHITIREVKGSYYGFDLEYHRGEWQIKDAYVQVGERYFNYYKGKFLGKKSLQPYLEKYVNQALKR